MRWAITGTPGTGKTTAVERLALERPVIHLNEIVTSHEFYTDVDASRNTTIADLEALGEWLANRPSNAIVESHISHLLAVDGVVVLRCHPHELRDRLRTRQGDATNESSIVENAESEALDLILAEAVERHGRDAVFEIDTTGRSPDEVARSIERAIRGEMDPRSGTVSFLEDG